MGVVQKFGGTIVHGIYGFMTGAQMTSTAGQNIKTSSDLVVGGDMSAIGGSFSSDLNIPTISTTSTSGTNKIGFSTSGKFCWWSTASGEYIPVSS